MATASRAVRKLRRIKRERTLAYRLGAMAVTERNRVQRFAYELERELGVALKRVKELEGQAAPKFKIERIPDDAVEPLIKEQVVGDEVV